MRLYDKYLLPRIIHFTCGLKPSMRQREKVIPLAKGRVLEVGIGSGLNLPYYDSHQVQQVCGLDPSPELWALAQEGARGVAFGLEFVEGVAEDIPLENDAVDTVVLTYTLCTLPQTGAAMDEMRRVLKPGGQLVFCEHGLAPDANVRKWQDRLNPLWKKFGGGCNLNRDVPALLEDGGFRIRDMDTMYIPGWKPGCFNYWGVARQA